MAHSGPSGTLFGTESSVIKVERDSPSPLGQLSQAQRVVTEVHLEGRVTITHQALCTAEKHLTDLCAQLVTDSLAHSLSHSPRGSPPCSDI